MSQPIFKPKKTHIIVPGQVFVEGWKNSLRRHLIPGLLTAVKTSRPSARLPIHQIWLRRIFLGFREVKSKPADLSLTQGGLMTNLEGVTRTSRKNESATTFWH
jgi:hypothetical protein